MSRIIRVSGAGVQSCQGKAAYGGWLFGLTESLTIPARNSILEQAMPSIARWFIVLGAANAALAVALGAAGAHALKPLLAANDPAGWFPLALQYHQFNALGLIAAGLAMAHCPATRGFAWAGGLLLAGILLFCGSLYLRSIPGIHIFHALTPIGGGAFIVGWLAFAGGALAARHHGKRAPTGG
jgi:uncharacterized membrane protein YgdD (TMEM256/DUF423 family)